VASKQASGPSACLRVCLFGRSNLCGLLCLVFLAFLACNLQRAALLFHWGPMQFGRCFNGPLCVVGAGRKQTAREAAIQSGLASIISTIISSSARMGPVERKKNEKSRERREEEKEREEEKRMIRARDASSLRIGKMGEMEEMGEKERASESKREQTAN